MSVRGADIVSAAWTRSSAWQLPLISLVILSFGAAVGLAPMWGMLHDSWSNIYGAFSHGYLVLAMSIWLGVTYWLAAPPTRLQPLWWAALPLVGVVVLLTTMELMFINSSRLALIPVLFLTIAAFVFGRDCALRLLWAAAFLYFGLPQWWVINGALQSLTSTLVNVLIEVTALPAYVEGNFIQVPAGMFEIASGCSGLNYLVAGLALAAFYAFMYLRQWKNRVALLAAAALMAIVSNCGRVYLLIVIGIATDMQHYLIRVNHLHFGWVLFIVLMAPVLLLARRLDDAEARLAEGNDTSRTKVDATAVQISPEILAAALCAGLVLLLPRTLTTVEASGITAVQPLPSAVAGRERQLPVASEWSPSFVGAQQDRATYTTPGDVIEVYRAVYMHQSSEQRLIRSENDFFGTAWRLVERGTSKVEFDGRAVSVNDYRGYLNARERVIWAWYWVAGRPASSQLEAKGLELRGLLNGRRDAAAIAISAECMPDCAAARARLAAFAAESAAMLAGSQAE